MSYLVLARKYRPRTFADVVGQETITATLRGAIEEGRIGHAYLFSGPRGTGKTTTARVLAKALNCERGPTADPCGTCERCVAADLGNDVDVVEIDAASNNGVDFVRELRERAAYMPLRARFKIYVIDEVHMLSKPAFNALLKTLEEPPPHVKFLFATTELHKVLETVLSRCQVLRLAPISEPTIAARLASVLASEGVKPGPGLVDAIARRARGGMRDALSLADQVLSLAGDEPTLEDLAGVAGDGNADVYERLLDAIEGGDAALVLASLPRDDGGDGEFVSGLLDHLRGALIAALSGGEHPLVSTDPSARERCAARAKRTSVERLQAWLQELVHARARMHDLAGHSRLILELALIDLARPEARVDLAELEERLLALERRLGGAPDRAPAPERPHAPDRPPASERAHAPDRPHSPERSHATGRESRGPSTNDASASAARPDAGRGRSADVAALASTPERGARSEGDASRPRVSGQQAARERAPSDAASHSAARERDEIPRPPIVRADPWAAFLSALTAKAPSLAEVLRSRAKLADEADGARIRLSGLSSAERDLVKDARNARTCVDLYAQLTGRTASIVIADEPIAERPKPAKDPFTARVADMFSGRIEETS